ncbi:MAG: TIGR03986 family CRISPR-associated RAMP protein, partial [Planctomycetales bacterium]|nr:TIGR03986 family CRISPR-associated RAMP protein [Planctomycetales bacterium]
LADLRLPFELRGSLRNADRKRSGNERSHCIKLRQGDLVCFNLLKNSSTIDRLAVSSIWRKAAGEVWDWFALIDRNLPPMNSSREQVTLAEQLFGFVQAGKSEHKVKALAGRLRFSSGRLCLANQTGKADESQETTPILGSPKPPSPQLYFHHANSDQAVRKSQMPGEAGGTIRPLGRKWYWHHRTVAWQSLDPHDARTKKQKTRIRPLRAGLEFVFDVEFTNLSRRELALLAYALRPQPEFRHRLGLGKPLGLGTVQVQPLGLFLTDRRGRYETDDLFGSPRYHRVAVCDGASPTDLELKLAAVDVQRRYRRELEAWRATTSDSPAPDWQALCQEAIRLLDQPEFGLADTRAALESLGNPATTADAPIHYPRLPDPLLPRVKIDGRERPNTEAELFRWHTLNQERPLPQRLSPLSHDAPQPNKLRRESPFMFFLHA